MFKPFKLGNFSKHKWLKYGEAYKFMPSIETKIISKFLLTYRNENLYNERKSPRPPALRILILFSFLFGIPKLKRLTSTFQNLN